jgi:transposase-like protein
VLKLFVGYERHFRRNRLQATMPSVVSSAQDQMDERLYMLAIKPYLEP